MIRAFIAVALEPSVIASIAAAINQLKAQIPGVRWVAPSNFHLTLKFLGEIDDGLIEPIGAALRQQLRLFPRCTINARSLGVFPDLKRPRVLWVGFAGSRMVALALRVNAALEPLGFAPETRTFTPHLTIGRWRQSERASRSLARQLERWQAYDFGASTVENVKLMQSVLKPEGAQYFELAAVPLSDEPGA